MFFVLIPIIGVAMVGIAYAWVLTYQQLREVTVLERPQMIALVSVLAATMQAPIPFLMLFFFVAPTNPGISLIAELEVLLCLVSLPCALIRKDRARWWLALSSVFFLAFTGMVYLVSQWQF